MEISESDIKVISGECIDKALIRFREGTCYEKHKEVLNVKEDISEVKVDIKTIREKQETLGECVRKKFNTMYFLLFGSLITLIINLIYAVAVKK